jgi:hypothetical protein
MAHLVTADLVAKAPGQSILGKRDSCLSALYARMLDLKRRKIMPGSETRAPHLSGRDDNLN